MNYNYFYVAMSAQKTADLLTTHISPRKFYHHKAQGGVDWRVEWDISKQQTRISLADTLDESVITFLLLKS